ncbi:dihydropyrimidinase [Marivita sp. GX14005]|uniref:dihydropyrimidinase n=1 Tax=Marivita sp. GX14005 TaxID=2942276 RepID=UPI002018C5A8|nr:dihydropyrimidinase [Marivita sp. GX14005]MCL3883122.1 dihydropyrimidinase [Marivita sp. GX14005]
MTQQFDLVIRGGTIATAADIFEADIGISDGRITALAADLPRGTDEIDATGKLVLPGGVDAHCHFDQPTSDGSKMADDFDSGPRSAAFGGTTTVIPFACQQKGQSLRAAVDDYHRRAEGKSVIDYAFHLIVTDPTPQVLGQELPALIREGYTSFKIYTTYDDLKLNDREIIEVLALAKREGALTMIHAENSDAIAWLTEALEKAGQTAPRHHADARPAIAEREATHRAISLAEIVDVPMLVVHVSGGEAMEQIAHARSKGLKVFAETCPQYILLTADDLNLDGFEGAKHICSPPPRDSASQRSVWRGLANGTFQVFSSDHAPFRFDDPQGKKVRGDGASFTHVPNGIPGVETRLALLFSEGVGKGRISLNRFVALTATNPARLYGLYPRKGTIAVGADADLAIWNTTREVTITNDALHHNVDYTPYEGRRVTGWPETVLSRGEVVVQGGTLEAKPGRGAFLECGAPDTQL